MIAHATQMLARQDGFMPLMEILSDFSLSIRIIRLKCLKVELVGIFPPLRIIKASTHNDLLHIPQRNQFDARSLVHPLPDSYEVSTS